MEINDIEQMSSEEMASWMAASLAKRNHSRILNLRIKDLFAIYDKMIDAPEEITLGDTASRELFTDRIEVDKLIANVPLYGVTVDGKQVYNNGEGFHWLDGEGLWQAMSEELDPVPDGDDDRLADWQGLPDDDLETLLRSTKEEGFISDYDIDEL